ncbi:MAG: hypothetical protein ABSG40_13810 [Terriglobales bacterium]|jgi:hypothetical protein
MDRIEQIAWDSEYAMAVLGKGTDFLLVDLDTTMPEEVRQDAVTRGYRFCGIFGFRNGRTESQFEPDPEAFAVMNCALFRFVQLVASKLTHVDTLERLYRLPDTREN